MRTLSRKARAEGKRIALVPTMGYLHQGHITLAQKARKMADLVVVSIFVNPIQFGPGEDLDRYPRDLKGDLQKLAAAGTDYVFTPSAGEIYPLGYQTHVEVENLSKGLCGAFRPGHFRGVATVVAKLFNIVQPDLALFGEKDFQQLRVVERMVKDLNFPVRIVAVPTVREPDGLAMSSRNSYLSASERKYAASLSHALFLAQNLVKKGETDPKVLTECAQKSIAHNPGTHIEYIEVRDDKTLEPVARIDRPCRMLLAVWEGKTRLIDNVRLNPKTS
jgi:pantoate--beta-alanine ligase